MLAMTGATVLNKVARVGAGGHLGCEWTHVSHMYYIFISCSCISMRGVIHHITVHIYHQLTNPGACGCPTVSLGEKRMYDGERLGLQFYGVCWSGMLKIHQAL